MKKFAEILSEFFNGLFCTLIRFYQKCISPMFPPCCRFYPTCSQYSLEAFQKYGPFKGLSLSARRILRCNRWCKGGYDPVPEKINCKEK